MKGYPNLHAAATAGAMRGGPADGFEHGLALFTAGLRQRHAELQKRRPAAAATDQRPPSH
jgi:hypothetical protein